MIISDARWEIIIVKMLRSDNWEGINLIILTVVFLALATVAVGLRIWAKRIRRRALGSDDYACFVAWVCSMFCDPEAGGGLTWAQVFTAGFAAEQIYGVISPRLSDVLVEGF